MDLLVTRRSCFACLLMLLDDITSCQSRANVDLCTWQRPLDSLRVVGIGIVSGHLGLSSCPPRCGRFSRYDGYYIFAFSTRMSGECILHYCSMLISKVVYMRSMCMKNERIRIVVVKQNNSVEACPQTWKTHRPEEIVSLLV